MHWHEFYFADLFPHHMNTVIPDEANVELIWAQNRESSLEHGKAQLTSKDEDPYRRVLSETEQCWDASYRNYWPDEARSLVQDPDSGHGQHSRLNRLQTLTHKDSPPRTAPNPTPPHDC